jgi:hypothetical protein
VSPVSPVAYFRGQPEVRFLDEWDGGRQKVMLLKPFVGYSAVLGCDVVAPAGFVSDGQSIPRLIVGSTGRECIRAGLLHDALYQLHRVAMDPFAMPIIREQADAAYREWLIADGVDAVHSEGQFLALRAGGQSAWDTGPARRRVYAVA